MKHSIFQSADTRSEFLMNCAAYWRPILTTVIFGMAFVTDVPGQEDTEDPSKETKKLAQLQFMRDAIQKISIKPTDLGDERDLTFKSQPLLRYSDPARNVADSAVWRVGVKGRPCAIVTSEVYGPENKSYRMSHEFLAINNPRLTMRCEDFTWMPPRTQALKFREFTAVEPPSKNSKLRLAQIKRLATKFTMREEFDGNKIELRLLPTPIDRYEPSEKPQADGAIFAAVWGVNPEALLFIETDGMAWSFAWARMGAAMVRAAIDDVEIWNEPAIPYSELATPTAPYANCNNPTRVPATLFDTTGDKKP